MKALASSLEHRVGLLASPTAVEAAPTGPRGPAPCLVDTTMLFAPASGGVKRYLLAKRTWMAKERGDVIHRLVLPAQQRDDDDAQICWVRSPALPLGNGYRWPLSSREWAAQIEACRPTLIEAGDPYTPGLAALRAGADLKVPVIGFCHTDLSALAALHFGPWAGRLAKRLWIDRCRGFDAILAPSRFMARVLTEAGLPHVQAIPLGVDTELFAPPSGQDARRALRRELGVQPGERLLVFAGRPSPEKRIDVLAAMIQRLGAPYRLLLVGAAGGRIAGERIITLPFEHDTRRLTALLGAADAFVHANPHETLGLIVLEAMSCGLPVVGPDGGGVGEIIDETIGARAAGASSQALAEAVASVFARDPSALGAAARMRALERHGWPTTFEALSRTYATLTGDGRFMSPERTSAAP